MPAAGPFIPSKDRGSVGVICSADGLRANQFGRWQPSRAYLLRFYWRERFDCAITEARYNEGKLL